MRMSPRFTIVSTLLLASGCDAVGNKSPEDKPSTIDSGDVIVDDWDDDTTTLSVMDHCGTVVTDETWTANYTHVVNCDVTMERGVLTIEAGTIVVFQPGGGLEIGTEQDEASLRVMGTEANPVQLRTEESADADSFWKGIFIGKNGKDVEIHHARISKGGNTLRSGLTFNGPVGLVDHVTIEGSGKCGLELSSGGSLHPDSTHITVRESEIPVCATLEVVHTLPATGSDYTGNNGDYIEIRRDELTESVEWENLGVPYAFTDQVKVGGTAANPAIIEIGPGTQLHFASGKGIKLAFGGGAAGLHARGTEEEPVVFSALGATVPGSWGGIDTALGVLPGEFTLTHTRIEYAGGGVSDAALYAYASEVKLNDVTIADCLQSGLGIRKGGRLAEGSDNILVTGCEEAAMLEPNAVGDLYDVNITFENATEDYIRLAVGSSEQPYVSRPATWRNLGLPFYAEKGIRVEGTAEAPATLTIEPGVEIYFDANKPLLVGQGGAGTLTIAGSASDPVRLLPYTSSIPGAWKGIEFSDYASTTNTLSHLEVAYAGGSGMQAAIDVNDGIVTVDNAYIHHSEECGVWAKESGGLDVTNSTFASNALADACGEARVEP